MASPARKVAGKMPTTWRQVWPQVARKCQGGGTTIDNAHLLTTRVLELGTTQCFDNLRLVAVGRTHRHDRLADAHTRHGSLRLAEGSAHSSLQPIGAGARQHLVDANDVERMHTHADVERILAAVLDEVLVAANATGLQSFGAQLLQLVGHQVHAQREVLDGGALAAQIKDADLGVGDTTAEPRLRVRLVLAVPVTGWQWRS